MAVGILQVVLAGCGRRSNLHCICGFSTPYLDKRTHPVDCNRAGKAVKPPRASFGLVRWQLKTPRWFPCPPSDPPHFKRPNFPLRNALKAKSGCDQAPATKQDQVAPKGGFFVGLDKAHPPTETRTVSRPGAKEKNSQSKTDKIRWLDLKLRSLNETLAVCADSWTIPE